MTENIGISAFLEKGKEKVRSGWNNLMEKMGKVRDRFDIFSEETKAELVVVSRPVIEGVKEVGKGIKNSYSEVEGNVFQRVGNVFKEGWKVMSEKAILLKSNVEKKAAGLKKRYEELGVGWGTLSLVHEAVERVEEVPAYVQGAMSIFEKKKSEVVAEKLAKTSIDDENGTKWDLLARTVEHIVGRKEKFEERALNLADKIVKMREGRWKLVKTRKMTVAV